jgi:aerobic-type carbon monoxide dehydrogenase small subunit (CoxS/CutS family)
MEEPIQFTLNGKSVQPTTDSDRRLLWVLRTDLGLTGTKYGCGKGFCGSCTVLVDNKVIRSCQMPLKLVKGKKIVTIEGVADNKNLHPLQQAFMKYDALQCGYCTPGMILKAYSFLQENPKPSHSDIIRTMNSNLCRCGSYMRIVQAIQSAAEVMRGA